MSPASRTRPSTEAATNPRPVARRELAWASTAALSWGQLAKPSSRAMTSWAAAKVIALSAVPRGGGGRSVCRAAESPRPGGVAQLLGLAAQLVEVGALGKRSGHGVSLLRLRSAAQAEEEATAMAVCCSEVDSVLPADPAAPSRRHPIVALAERSLAGPAGWLSLSCHAPGALSHR